MPAAARRIGQQKKNNSKNIIVIIIKMNAPLLRGGYNTTTWQIELRKLMESRIGMPVVFVRLFARNHRGLNPI